MFKISFLGMMSLLALGCTHDTSTVVFLPGSQDAGLTPTADAGNDGDVVHPGQDGGGIVDPTTTPDASPDVVQADAGTDAEVDSAVPCECPTPPPMYSSSAMCVNNVCVINCISDNYLQQGNACVGRDNAFCMQGNQCLSGMCNNGRCAPM